jgi:hypothetical protein
LSANQEVVLENIKGNARGIIAEIDPKNESMIVLNVLRSPKREEYKPIALFKQHGMHQGRNYTRPHPASWKNPYYSLISIEFSYSSVLPDVRSRAPDDKTENGNTLSYSIPIFVFWEPLKPVRDKSDPDF